VDLVDTALATPQKAEAVMFAPLAAGRRHQATQLTNAWRNDGRRSMHRA